MTESDLIFANEIIGSATMYVSGDMAGTDGELNFDLTTGTVDSMTALLK